MPLDPDIKAQRMEGYSIRQLNAIGNEHNVTSCPDARVVVRTTGVVYQLKATLLHVHEAKRDQHHTLPQYSLLPKLTLTKLQVFTGRLRKASRLFPTMSFATQRYFIPTSDFLSMTQIPYILTRVTAPESTVACPI
jgi:hypothetical protein